MGLLILKYLGGVTALAVALALLPTLVDAVRDRAYEHGGLMTAALAATTMAVGVTLGLAGAELVARLITGRWF